MNKPVVLVTGASRGIGKAIFEHFLALGECHVVGTATSQAGVDKIQSSIVTPDQGQARILNVDNLSDIEAFMQTLQEGVGLPTILVSNAGITADNLLMRMSELEWSSVIQTNLTAAFHLSKALSRHMLKQRFGRIILIGSVVASMGNAGQANYCAAKAGLIGFAKALSRELGSRGVTVNVVAPGFIETDMTQALPDNLKTALVGQIPLGRIGQAHEIAKAVGFLASEDASYITGQTLHVNGGMWSD